MPCVYVKTSKALGIQINPTHSNLLSIKLDLTLCIKHVKHWFFKAVFLGQRYPNQPNQYQHRVPSLVPSPWNSPKATSLCQIHGAPVHCGTSCDATAMHGHWQPGRYHVSANDGEAMASCFEYLNKHHLKQHFSVLLVDVLEITYDIANFFTLSSVILLISSHPIHPRRQDTNPRRLTWLRQWLQSCRDGLVDLF